MPIKRDLLLSLPPNMCRSVAACEPAVAAAAHCSFDPPGRQLGSGGGTAHLLVDAWRASGEAAFADWLDGSQKIVMHGGGESRRLPAYAGPGKLFLPMPALRWARGQRLDQTLLDLQRPFLDRVLDQAPAGTRVMIGSGDVVLRSEAGIPDLPDADVVLLGMWAQPEAAQHFGVMFCDREHPAALRKFLQKPGPDRIREMSRDHLFLIDVGVWLLSARAVACLLAKCGWNGADQDFAGGAAGSYDLYGQWALHLGSEPAEADADVGALTVGVAPLRTGEFYHFGTSADMIDSMFALQNVVLDQTQLGPVPSLAQPRQFIQNADFGVPVRRQENHSLWVENSCVPATWSIANRHVITGVPTNDWAIELPPGVCLDFVPVGASGLALRVYGFGDAFRGAVGDEATQWIEAAAPVWFAQRGIELAEAGIDPATDLQLCALFPVIEEGAVSAGLVQWMIDGTGADPAAARAAWLAGPRLSARELAQTVNLDRLYAARTARRRAALPLMAAHGSNSLFFKIDLGWVAREFGAGDLPLPPRPSDDNVRDPMLAVHEAMFRSQVLRDRGDANWRTEEAAAFHRLAEAIIEPLRRDPVVPVCTTLKDQIVWGRSPARIDLAGGWTDTPPFCMEHGGSVVNIGINLNGQPPIQVFARRSDRLSLTIRSIDLGVSEELTTYDEVGRFRGVGSGFSVARGAFALAGFHPDFNGGRFDSLEDQLRAFGGGIDISMLAAIPKGSGLGTSSILAGTLLATLGDLCGLGWDLPAACSRVTALEQMLGSGGGWQDQYGGLLSGIKCVETVPGLRQLPSVRWLPPNVIADHRERWILYYTGITRVARDVLSEIVRGMFLNDGSRLEILRQIRANAGACFEAVQRNQWGNVADAIAESWRLNQQLDCGTNPPEVAALVERVAPFARALKLSGAGGGGFLLILAESDAAAAEVRAVLNANPGGTGARLVDLALSATGLEITRS